MIYYGKTKKSTHGHRTTLPFCTHFTLATQSAPSYRNPRATVTLPCTYPIPTLYLPYITWPGIRIIDSPGDQAGRSYPVPTLHLRPSQATLYFRLSYTPSYPIRGRGATLHLPSLYHSPTQCLSALQATKSDRPTLHLCCPLCGGLPYTTHSPGPKTVHPSDQVQPAYPTPSPSPDDSHPEGDRHPHTAKSRRATLHPSATPPTRPRLAGHTLGKSRRRTAYPQQIVTTRLLYCLQDRFAQLSRLQRI